MKKFLPLLSIPILMAACNTSPDKIESATATPIVQQMPAATADTTGLAAYNNWKLQNELAEFETVQPAKQPKASTAVAKKSTPVKKTSSSASSAKSSTPVSNPETYDPGSYDSGAGDGTETAGTGSLPVEPAKEEKTGISKAAKGAVIGGLGGAAAGAVINKKNRVAGGVIGAVVGAAGGYVLGRQMDKKDGRQQ